MPLTHVCVWDSKIGYRRVSIDEACAMYPYGTVRASSGHFVCELCAENVCLTAPGAYARHFRHDSASQNKECEERQQAYTRTIASLNNHPMPIRIQVTGNRYMLQMGFISPSRGNERPRCSLIKIGGDAHQKFEYSFERIEDTGITYLDIGNIPSQKYYLSYEKPSAQLSKFWPSTTPGMNSGGTFFDAASGRMLQTGSKASPGKSYYLLQRAPMYQFEIPNGITMQKITEVRTPILTTWSLYKLDVHSFTEAVARFFLKRSIFLTEKPTVFYPIWPPYVEDPYFLYHRNNELYFYMKGENAELKTFPITSTSIAPLSDSVEQGKLYRIMASSKEQLLSLGISGALGFSYLVRKELDHQAEMPVLSVTDSAGTSYDEAVYDQLPKGKCLTIMAPFDGKAIVKKDGKILFVYRIAADQMIEIDQIAFGIQLELYQGCDFVRSIGFERKGDQRDSSQMDEVLVTKLQNAGGVMVPIPHSIGASAQKLQDYPKTKLWLRKMVRAGEMPQQALRLLMKHIQDNKERSHND